MDGKRFDHALRHLGRAVNRRSAVRALASLGLGGGLAAEALDAAHAKKRTAKTCKSRCLHGSDHPVDACTCACSCKGKSKAKCHRVCSVSCRSRCSLNGLSGHELCACTCACLVDSAEREACLASCAPDCTGITCSPGQRLDPKMCQCVSSCDVGTEYCNGACLPNCPVGATRNPASCVCCLPTGTECGPQTPTAPCCFPAGTGACGGGNVCAGQADGGACQFSGQCRRGVNCVNNLCTP